MKCIMKKLDSSDKMKNSLLYRIPPSQILFRVLFMHVACLCMGVLFC